MKSFFVLAFILSIPVDSSTVSSTVSSIEPSYVVSAVVSSTAKPPTWPPSPQPTTYKPEPERTGLKCFQCFSTKSFKECKVIQKELECPAGTDLCYKRCFDGRKGHIQAEFYSKGCTSSKKECKQVNEDLYKMEEFGEGNPCRIEICQGNLCNAAALPVISCFIFIACACLAFLH